MMNEKELEMNAEALSEIAGIMGNPTLNVQVLCLMQLVSKGIFLSVELIMPNFPKVYRPNFHESVPLVKLVAG